MRIAVLSDIHANRQALAAVAKDIESQRVDETWCLGDVVGYGANPQECLDWVEAHATTCIQGNHDHAVASGEMAWFNPVAAQAARFHAQILPPPERARLFAWPQRELRQSGGGRVLLVHGSPDDPLHEYVRPADASNGQRRWGGLAEVILMGHTHLPYLAVSPEPRGSTLWTSLGFDHALRSQLLNVHGPVLVNPGSVGQPRDGDPRASYVVLDMEERKGELRRVVYDTEGAAHAIVQAGLDHSLAARLLRGR